MEKATLMHASEIELEGTMCTVIIKYCQELGRGLFFLKKKVFEGFPGGAVVENLPANAGDTGSSPGLGRSHMPRSN